MYDYIGEKIKAIASIIGWVLLVIGIIVWVVSWFYSDGTFGWIALVLGVYGFVSSWFLYGFGQLVDDASKMVFYLKEISNSAGDPVQATKNLPKATKNKSTISHTEAVTPVKAVITTDGWICGSCQTKNNLNYGQCKKCGSFKG